MLCPEEQSAVGTFSGWVGVGSKVRQLYASWALRDGRVHILHIGLVQVYTNQR